MQYLRTSVDIPAGNEILTPGIKPAHGRYYLVWQRRCPLSPYIAFAQFSAGIKRSSSPYGEQGEEHPLV
jgi:hypothetical protein